MDSVLLYGAQLWRDGATYNAIVMHTSAIGAMKKLPSKPAVPKVALTKDVLVAILGKLVGNDASYTTYKKTLAEWRSAIFEPTAYLDMSRFSDLARVDSDNVKIDEDSVKIRKKDQWQGQTIEMFAAGTKFWTVVLFRAYFKRWRQPFSVDTNGKLRGLWGNTSRLQQRLSRTRRQKDHAD